MADKMAGEPARRLDYISHDAFPQRDYNSHHPPRGAAANQDRTTFPASPRVVPSRPPSVPFPPFIPFAMAEPLGRCVDAVRDAAAAPGPVRAEPGLLRALRSLRSRHTRRPGGAARFRERGGLGPLLELLGPDGSRRVLDLALSVLGNCCTEPGCRRQARSLGGIPRLGE